MPGNPGRNSLSGWLIPVDQRARRLAALTLAGGFLATVAIWWWRPISWLPACPTKTYLGVYCPGCGSLRATHRVLTGRWDEAWRYNILLVTLGLPLAVWYWSEQVVILARGLRFRPPIRGAWIAWLLLSLMLIFTVLRNLPGDSFSRLRPPG